MNFNKLIEENKIKTIGRTRITDDKLYFNFSGSGICFKTKTDKLIIRLYSPKFNDANSYPYISVLIDNERYDYGVFEEHQTIEMTLSKQIHKVEILKRTESPVSFVAIEDISALEFIPLEIENNLKIEFYGDSITCGYGILTNNPNHPFTTHTESFLDSYAYLTAKTLGADYSAICVSGFPVYKSRWNEGFPIESIMDMISICDYSEDMTFETAYKWDNSQFIPHIVVVNLGTNDCSYFTEGQNWIDELILKHGSFEKALQDEIVKERLNNLGEKIKSSLDCLFNVYGENIKIIWALGMLEINSHVQEVIDKALNEYNNPNVYQFQFTSLKKSNERGANWHPSKMMHFNAKEELVYFIESRILRGE